MTQSSARPLLSPTAILLTDVSCRYNRGQPNEVLALSAVSLAVIPGEIVGIVGPSGSGKTTLLEVIAGLRSPDSGAVFLDGVAMPRSSTGLSATRRRNLRFIFQSDNLVPYLTATENVQLMGAIVAKKTLSKKEALRLLESLGLNEKTGRRLPRELSGGEQQRVAIARALVGEPQVILADEPTARLDRKNAKEAMEALVEAAHVAGAALLVVSHDEEHLRSFAGSLYRVLDGEVLRVTPSQGKPAEHPPVSAP